MRRHGAALNAVRSERNSIVTAQDGTRLATDVYLPEAVASPLATILVRTPYGKGDTMERSRFSRLLRQFVDDDFAVVIQDCRGRWQSEGEFRPCLHEAADGCATLDWIAAQPWSNGRVGTYGCSFLGENQILLAARRHPAHRAAIAEAAGGAVGSVRGLHRYFGLYEHNVLALSGLFGWAMLYGSRVMPRLPIATLDAEVVRELERRYYRDRGPRKLDLAAAWRHLPLIDAMREYVGPAFAEVFEEFAGHGAGDAFWNALGFIDDGARFAVPTLHVNAWYDYGIDGTLLLHELMQRGDDGGPRRDDQYLMVFPTCHCAWSRSPEEPSGRLAGERDVGEFDLDYASICRRWMRRWLRDETDAIESLPRAQVYMIGANEWRELPAWPPADRGVQTLYLSSTQGANSRLGDGVLEPRPPAKTGCDAYSYDPANPVPSLGGNMSCTTDLANEERSMGAHDQSQLELREDVLVYTSEPLVDPVEILGRPEVELHVSSSAPDTDFTVKLVEVTAAGQAYNVSDSIFRCRHRHGLERNDPLLPGEIVTLRFGLPGTGLRVAAGHRLRVEVSSSNFPRFARNLNTGGDNHRDRELRVARNVLHFGPAQPSCIRLPVLRAGRAAGRPANHSLEENADAGD